MTAPSSTVRTSAGPTVDDKRHSDSSLAAAARILAHWRSQSKANVLRTIEAFPQLVNNKSLLLDLVLEEYKQRDQEAPLEPGEFCQKFHHLGSALEHSILHALEVQHYFDDHPEIFAIVADFQWPVAGDCLEGFQVVEEIGRGALARVFLCREADVGQREVVVKVARGGEYEAELLGRLDHPNIVPVYSVTNDRQRCASYICMPYRGRSTLQDVVDNIRKRGIPNSASIIMEAARLWDQTSDRIAKASHLAQKERSDCVNYVDEILRIAIELSSALAHAHSVGVYHSDLKPSNVLLTQDGKPLLIDFNLATDLQSGAVPRGGTLAYMPPEQLDGMSQDPPAIGAKYDARSEVYSFGALLFQLLTGEVPFHVDSEHADPVKAAKYLIDQQRVLLPHVRSRNRAVNAALERLVLKCVALNPDDRPQSMGELQRDLQTQVRPIARVCRLIRARPTLGMILAGVGLIGLLCGVLYLILRQPYYDRQLARGMTRQQRGLYRTAVDYFNRAIESEPKRREALYERARALLLLGNSAAALPEFSRVAEEFADPRSAAYAGYCFNLAGNMSEAIPWYEIARNRGFETAGLHNNLGVSYATGRSQAGRLERLARAQYHLERALELDQSSPVVRGNLVMLALMQSDEDPTFKPISAVAHLEFLLGAIPHSPRVMVDAVKLYSLLSLVDSAYAERALTAIESSIRWGNGPTVRELSTNPRFAAIRHDPKFAKILAAARAANVELRSDILVSFIDPVTDGTPVAHTR